MKHCKYVSVIFLSLICGCAVLTKQSRLVADLSSSKALTVACDQQGFERAFFLNINNDKILVNIEQQNEQEWIGPIIFPLIPNFGNKVWIKVSSNKTKSEAVDFGEWKLAGLHQYRGQSGLLLYLVYQD